MVVIVVIIVPIFLHSLLTKGKRMSRFELCRPFFCSVLSSENPLTLNRTTEVAALGCHVCATHPG